MVNVQLSDRNDSGEDGNNWAKDDMHRQIRVTETSPGVYKVEVYDNGRFAAIAGQKTPGNDDGNDVFSSAVSGSIKGSFTTTVNSAPDFANFVGLPKSIGGTVSTPQMIEELFSDPSPMSGFNEWGWTYKKGQQVWTNTEAGNDGNIAG